MSLLFRSLLFLISAGALVFVLRKIRNAQMQIEGAVFWILFMLGLVVISVFPGAMIQLAGLLGVESPANFVFLCIIFLLLLKLFHLSIQISKMQYQIRQLTQAQALAEWEKAPDDPAS